MRGLFYLVVLVLLLKSSFSQSNDLYPNSISKFTIRRDIHTGSPVKSGTVHTLPKKSTVTEFKRHLQCSHNEPNLNYNSGMISTLRLTPPTSEILKLCCTYIERRCDWHSNCRQFMEEFEAGSFRKDENFNELNQFSKAYLLRIMDGQVYYDWPWGIDRFPTDKNENTMVSLIKLTLDRLTDIRDSVFFVSGDQPNIELNRVIPIFSHSTAESYSDMVWPWYEMWQDANRVYKTIRQTGLEFTEQSYERLEPSYLPWSQRIPKAAYYATLFLNRQFMYDDARLHPDMFDAHFTSRGPIEPWNPSSTEVPDDALLQTEKTEPDKVAAAQSLPAGFSLPLANLSLWSDHIDYRPGSYKYVIVPLGAGAGLSTSGRLQHILSNSGAVVLMQRSAFKFHISAQFLPWIHYVPVSFSGSDVVEKVQWLRDHDDFAQQIAENGRNFARSYLRLEDYYCYAVNALEIMADISNLSVDALKPFNPRKLQPLNIRFGDTAAFEWPV